MLVIPNGFIHRHARQYKEGRGCKDVFNACCLVCFSVTLMTIGATLLIVGFTYVTQDGHRSPDVNLTLSGFILLGVGFLLMVTTIIYKTCSRKQYLKESEQSPEQLEAAHPLQAAASNTELPEIPVWINVASPLEQHFLRGHGHRHGLSLGARQHHWLTPSRFDKTVNGQLVTHSAVFGQVPKPRLGLY